MRSKVRNSSIFGRAAFALLLVAVMLAAPIGVQSARAQDDLAIQTRVQILHASPDLGKCEVHINYDEAEDEFEYGDQSDWIDFEPGGARVTITADRAGFNYAIFDAVYPTPAGNDYYMVITDALVLGGVFERSHIPDGGARVQIVQGSVDLPAVDINATGNRVSFATQLSYGRSSDPTVVPAGTYDLEVTLSDSGDVALTMPGLALEGNMTYQLVIMGEPNNEDHPLEIRPLVDTTLEESQGTPTA
jgi:hypothetical protein